jgi:hypothetical protein
VVCARSLNRSVLRDPVIPATLIPLGAYVDAIMAGADEADADNIAKAIEARPWPTYEERMAVFSPAGPWKPSRDPFSNR